MAVRFPYRGWLFDLDGTIYVGERLVPGAAEVVAALRAEDRRLAFLTNKPLETRADYARKLTRLGFLFEQMFEALELVQDDQVRLQRREAHASE